ncbi:MAG: hypothetical protein KJ906_01385 [Nanoarchaeota archaeon]|nr:hypothetical protein [Nanoarchaeota archaeon]
MIEDSNVITTEVDSNTNVEVNISYDENTHEVDYITETIKIPKGSWIKKYSIGYVNRHFPVEVIGKSEDSVLPGFEYEIKGSTEDISKFKERLPWNY